VFNGFYSTRLSLEVVTFSSRTKMFSEESPNSFGRGNKKEEKEKEKRI